MKQKIYINDQGELLLIEAPEPIRKSQGVYDFIYPDLKREYDQALTSAIEKGIRFRDQEATKWLLINEFNGKENMRGWFQPGKSFDLPNGYTAQVRTDCGCSNLKGPSKEGQEAGGKNPYKCVHEDLKVAVLIPLKQDKCNVCFDEWPETCPKCSKSGEPGNEAKKDEVSLYDQLKTWLSEVMLNPKWTWQQITKDDGQYFAINDGKRFVAYNHDVKFGKTWFGIREDGDTRTVFNGDSRNP